LVRKSLGKEKQFYETETEKTNCGDKIDKIEEKLLKFV
jgi:hypothetical protein